MRKDLGLATIACALFGCVETGADAGEPGLTSNIQLARFEMSNGNRLTLTSIAPDNEIVISETTPAGTGERFVVDDFPGATPLELFARLTPAGTAVPSLLADSATDADLAAWMAERPIGDTPGAGVFSVDVEDLGWRPFASAAPGNGSCDSATGYLYFEDHHCGTAGGYGYGVAEGYCNRTANFSAWEHFSADKMRHTYTRSAVCNGTGWIRHSRKTISGWLTVLDEAIEPNTVATYYSYKKDGLKHDRKSRVEPIDPYDTDAFVRLWTTFHDQVTGNAP